MSTRDTRARLGTLLVARRKSTNYGYTQAQLASLAGVSERTIRNVESGQRVSSQALAQIETVLGLPPGAASTVLDGGSDHLPDSEGRYAMIDVARARELRRTIGDDEFYKYLDWLTRGETDGHETGTSG